MSALRRSLRTRTGWTPASGGGRRSSVPVAQEGPTTPDSVFASFSAFLDDVVDEDPEDGSNDFVQVPIVKEEMEHGRVAQDAHIGSLEWDELRNTLPSNLHNISPGRGNSAAAAVWSVLDEIGTGSPGWEKCSAASRRGEFTRSSGEVQWNEARRGQEAESAMETFRRSLQAKANCLREHATVGGHKLCGGDDFYTALDEYNVILERETRDAVAMLASALLPKKKSRTWCRVAKALGVKDDQTELKVPVGESVETYCTQLPDDTAARRLRLSLARKKYEGMVNVADIDELEDADGDVDAVRSRLRRKVVERQKNTVMAELRHPSVSQVFQREKNAVLSQLGKACAKLVPEAVSVVAMSGAVEGTTRVRRFAADSACNVHLVGEESDLKDARVVHFQVMGTAGASSVTKTGTVVGTAVDDKGEQYEFKFKCSALKGLTMNLLSISQLLTEGSIVHLEKGNSYILVKDRVCESMRKLYWKRRTGCFSCRWRWSVRTQQVTHYL